MKVYFMRHGETDWNKQGLIQGSADIPLNENGKALAVLTGEGFAREGIMFDRIYSSPYIRAVQTASIIAEKTLKARATEINSPLQMISEESGIVIDKRIREMSFGKYEGVPVSQLHTNKEYRKISLCFDDPVHYVNEPPAESYDDVFNRVCSFLKRELVPQQENCETVLVVCHGAVLRAFISIIKRLMLSEYWNIDQPNCSVNIVNVDGYEFSMLEEKRLYYETIQENAGGRG